MKNFILGVVFGVIIGGTFVAFADVGVLFNSLNEEIGTTAKPLYVEVI